MPTLLPIAAGLLLIALPAPALTPPAVTPPVPHTNPADQPADEPARIIVRVDRRRAIHGHVAFEDEATVFVRLLDGQLERFLRKDVRAVVYLVEPEPGQTGVVYLHDGQRRQGIIIEDGFDGVVLEIAGVRTTLKREAVDFVTLNPTFAEQYEERKADLHPELPERHLELCEWLISIDRQEVALRELEALLELHDLEAAHRMHMLVAAQIALQKRRGGYVPPDAGDKPDPRRIPLGPDGEPLPLLTREDVNLIRVFEIDFNRPPKLDVTPATIREILSTYATSSLIPDDPDQRKSLFRAAPVDIVQLMFALRARELYPQINVMSEPYALNIFRQRVHDAWLMNSCATSRCHGGADSGRFFLHRRGYKDAEVRYTNLLILEKLRIESEWPLINYESPIDSLIIQYGLPRPIARKPHPEIRGWKAVFRSREDRMIRNTTEWLEAMMKPRMVYPVEYEPPALDPIRPAEEAPPPRRDR